MKTIQIVSMSLVLLPALVAAAKGPKVPEAINQAHTFYVQSVDGEETKPGLAREDMQVIAYVRTALRNWGRYTFTDDRSKADLIFVVRVAKRRSDGSGGMRGGQLGGGGGGGTGGGGINDMPAQQGGQFGGGGGEAAGGINDASVFDVDRLDVCQLKPNGKLTGAIWSRSMENGFAPPRMLLFAQFKDEVEKAYPAAAQPQEQPANK
jgi:hypothetical protein